MALSNNNIFRMLRDTYDTHIHNVHLFEDKRAELSKIQQETQTLQTRVQQSDSLVALLTTQAIEQSIYNNAAPFLATLQGRTDKPLMLQARPMTDTIWMIAVLVADLFQTVKAPEDQPIKVWIFDPKQRLGNHHDLHEQLLRTGDTFPGIHESSGMLAQLSVDVTTGDLIFISTSVVQFAKPAPTGPVEVPVEPITEEAAPETAEVTLDNNPNEEGTVSSDGPAE